MLTLLTHEALRRQCTRSFYEFIRHAWPHVDPSPFIPAWHIRVMARYLQAFADGDVPNLIINIPPGHGKSLIASVMFPAWVWTRSPEKIFLCAAHIDKLSTRDSVRCRDLIRSDWYQRVFSPSWAMRNDQDEKTYYVNTSHGARWSMGVSSGGTGTRGNYVIIDDPSDAQRGTTPQALDNVIDWHDQKMLTRRLNPLTGEMLIMQRLHERDLVGHILSKYSENFAHLMLQAEYDPDAVPAHANTLFRDPRAPGDLLFPELYDAHKMRLLKLALGTYGVSSQMQQAPKPRTGGYFVDEMFPRYSYADITPGDFVEAFSSWDCAVEGGAGNDKVSGQIWGRLRKDHPKYPGRLVLWDSITKNADMVENIKMIKALHEKHPWVHEKVIEKKANGAPIIQLLKNQFGDSYVDAFEPGARSKEVRASAVSPVCEAGMVIIPSPDEAPWVREWLTEMTAFPKGRNDDQVDATTQALLRLTQTPEWAFAC